MSPGEDRGTKFRHESRITTSSDATSMWKQQRNQQALGFRSLAAATEPESSQT